MKNNKNSGSSRILIVNVNWIGDVLFSTPFIRALRKGYPDSFIACMVPPRCREILKLNPNLNEVVVYDEKVTHGSIAGKLKFISNLKKKKFDTVILLHRSFTKALMAYLIGAKKRIGYHTAKRGFLLTMAIEPPKGDVHKVDYFLNIAERIGLKKLGREYELFIDDSDREYVKELLVKNGIEKNDSFIVINPGGNWGQKRWPKENFALLIERLIKELNAKVVISGAKKDIHLAEEIRSLVKSGDFSILCGKTTLRQLAALLERSSAVISNDTGPTHIAASMKTPLVALFGPTSQHITGPVGKGKISVISKVDKCAVPCYNMACTDNRCMALIGVDEVMAKVKAILG